MLGLGVVARVWDPWISSARYTISVAAGHAGSFGQKLFLALKRQLSETALGESGSRQESADRFQSGKYDLALVRNDHPAATLVILRRLSLVQGSQSAQKASVVRSEAIQALSRVGANTGLRMYCTSGVSSSPPNTLQFQ